MKKTKILCILDGFGLTKNVKNNCIASAKMPNLKNAFTNYKTLILDADGSMVGMEDGLVGNSEVGHMNIGGLKMIPQLSYQITESAKENYKLDKNIAPDQNFDAIELLKKFFNDQKHKKTTSNDENTVHLISLFSSGRVHSDLRHVKSAIVAAHKAGASKIILHVITDGRDADKRSFYSDYSTFKKENEVLFKNVYIGSVSGRFYAMDRDNNRDRVLRACEAMFSPYQEEYKKNKFNRYYSSLFEYFKKEFAGLGVSQYTLKRLNAMTDQCFKYYYKINDDDLAEKDSFFKSSDDYAKEEEIKNIIEYNYSKGDFDEHIEPISFTDRSEYSIQEIKRNINPGDTVWFINYRTDRFKQLAWEFLNINKKLDFGLNIIANNDYGIKDFESKTECKDEFDYFNPSYYAIFKASPNSNPLCKTLSEKGLNHLHISETEKYNHVTYFFNGGQDKKFDLGKWKVIDSNKIKSHAQKPEMKAKEVTDYIVEEGIGKFDFVVVNYANPDMVGHTGDFEAGVKALEFLDIQIGRLIDSIKANEGAEMIITADHGNIENVGEYVVGQKHLLNTEHDPNPVPCLYITEDFDSRIHQISKNIKKYRDDGIITFDKKTENLIESIENKFHFLDVDKQSNSIVLNSVPQRQFPLYLNGVIILSMFDSK